MILMPYAMVLLYAIKVISCVVGNFSLSCIFQRKKRLEARSFKSGLKSVVASKELTSFIRGQQEQVLQLEAGS
jgi:predicted transcriptional regulator